MQLCKVVCCCCCLFTCCYLFVFFVVLFCLFVCTASSNIHCAISLVPCVLILLVTSRDHVQWFPCTFQVVLCDACIVRNLPNNVLLRTHRSSVPRVHSSLVPGRNKCSKEICSWKRLERERERICLRHHETTVVTMTLPRH